MVVEPLVEQKEVFKEYEIKLKNVEELLDLIVALQNDCFREMNLKDIRNFYKDGILNIDFINNEVAATLKKPHQ
ncbi:hypothetical protein [Cytobacillus oceanisediminis]|uniref:hypothetical protein n=1 Tax=Cytobacillus oceanisediminis TaxID=665099 RepID=UPI0011A71D73|nr:hypothetical protein [Cytobacillus oceanisediminis]